METAVIFEIISAVWRELVKWRLWVVGFFILAAFSILGVGLMWPEKYETSTMLYADVTNIIEPLLKGRAEITSIDRSGQARELIYTRRIMKRVALENGLFDSAASIERQESEINSLRANITIKAEGKNYFRVVYKNNSQDASFRILNSVVDAFIRDTSERRRMESREAFEFIAQQVSAYKRQLLSAEKLLKDFRSRNLDGSLQSVNARINQLRQGVEELKLTISEIDARERSLQEQLKNESEHLSTQSKVEEQRSRLDALKGRLDILRLSYQETYPDVVSLKEQIKSQELVVEAMQDSSYVAGASASGSLQNPLYEELRKRQAETEVDLRSQRRRKQSMENMLGEEYERAKRVASKEAELSELVRDYDVNREIYEEMLERKESARLSMVLDVEGQGVSFKIQEPAVFPLQPSGLRFIHF
ncbi:MAG TPA: chain length-determining protein, partial [Porticoccus sp.]|nr:chain length-determining protein [Porticoccus sp.]